MSKHTSPRGVWGHAPPPPQKKNFLDSRSSEILKLLGQLLVDEDNDDNNEKSQPERGYSLALLGINESCVIQAYTRGWGRASLWGLQPLLHPPIKPPLVMCILE